MPSRLAAALVIMRSAFRTSTSCAAIHSLSMDLVPRPSDRLGISRVRVQNTSILAVIIQCIACDTSVSHVLPNKFGLLGRAERRSTRRSGQPAPSVPCVKFQRRAAHAVTLAIAVATAAVEDVAEVRAAAGAADLCAHHPVRFVVEQLDGFRRDRLGEARPAAARSGTSSRCRRAGCRRRRIRVRLVIRGPVAGRRAGDGLCSQGGSARYARKDESCRL